MYELIDNADNFRSKFLSSYQRNLERKSATLLSYDVLIIG
jgi:hypothetical protein